MSTPTRERSQVTVDNSTSRGTLFFARESTGYTGRAGRDVRIDMLRGVALVLFAVAVLIKVSDPQTQAYDSTATVAAVAFIITLEGALLGMLYRPRLPARLGESALRVWRRARSWYLSCLSVVVAIVLLGQIPGVNTDAITVLELGDQPFLFGAPPTDAAELAIAYPLDPGVLLDIVLLRVGPWPLDVAVLIVTLLMIAPLCMLALSRGRWLVLFACSVSLYAIELMTTVRLLPTRAEANLPILGWQLVFVLGMTAGHYRREVVQWCRRGAGLALFVLLATAAVTWLVLPAALGLAGQRVSADLLAAIAGPQTGWLFEPSAPGPLRVALAAIMAVTAYGALTVGWRPLSRVLAWLLAPIGSAVMPALVLLVCAAVTTSNFADATSMQLPVAAIVVIVVAVMWVVALIGDRARRKRDPR